MATFQLTICQPLEDNSKLLFWADCSPMDVE